MKNAKGLTRNPLGIVALFISLIYGFACLVLSSSLANLLGENERLPLIWFVIGFPVLILISFILLVIYHHEKLYAPIDYKDEKHFVSTFRGKAFRQVEEKSVEITTNNEENKKAFKQLVLKTENPNYNKELFPKEARANLNLANLFLEKLRLHTREITEKGLISSFGFGIQAPEYFLISYSVSDKILKQKGHNHRDTVIIRVTENQNGKLCLIAIGKDIQETSANDFAKKFAEYIEEVINRMMKEENVA